MPNLKNIFGQNNKEEANDDEEMMQKAGSAAKNAINTSKKTVKGIYKFAKWLAAAPIAVKVVLFAVIFITVAGFFYDIMHWVTDRDSGENNPETMYDMFVSKNDRLSDIITIAGNEENGYYLAFKQGVEDRIEEIAKEYSKPDTQTFTNEVTEYGEDGEVSEEVVDKELLLNMIKAELYTQYPDLGGAIGGESNISLGQETEEKYKDGKMDIPDIEQTADDAGLSAATAAVLSYLTEEDVKEKDLIDWSKEIEFDSKSPAEAFIQQAARNWQAGTVKKITSRLSVGDALENGRPVIAYVKAGENKLFTDNAQYIVLTDINKKSSGTVVDVNNPNKDKTDKGYYLDTEVDTVAEAYYIFDAKAAVKEGTTTSITITNSSTPASTEETTSKSNTKTSSNKITSLDGFVFIGDSITVGMDSVIDEEGVTFFAKSATTATDWLKKIQGKKGSIEIDGDFPKKEDIKGINVFLGTNGYGSTVDDMKKFLDELHKKYPETPIFVDELLPDLKHGAPESRENFKKEIKGYCNGKGYLNYIEVGSGVTMGTNDFHPATNDDYKKLFENIKAKIVDSTVETQTVITTSQDMNKLLIGEDTGKGLDGFQGSIRIRRVMPNKELAEIKNVGTGDLSITNSVTGSIAGDIKKYIDDNDLEGNWTVYVQNLETGDVEANINSGRKMQSASIIKLFIAATVYDEKAVENGVVSESDVSSMISNSDNEATNRIINALGGGNDEAGFTKINNYIKANGYSANTQINRIMFAENPKGDNYTSAKDVGKILKAIYEGKCVSKEASNKILGFMKNQTYKHKIPAGLPAGVESANKTGELATVENDAAIVYKSGAPYILVVLSSGLTDTSRAQRNIKEISTITYDNVATKTYQDNDDTVQDTTTGGEDTSNEKHVIAVVAGHGNKSGSDKGWYETGTQGKTSDGKTLYERDLTKKVADYVAEIFKENYPNFTVVTDGYSKKNTERLDIAKKKGAEIYVGVHFNGNDDKSVKGTGVYYQKDGSNYVDTSVQLGNCLQEAVQNAMGTQKAEGVAGGNYAAFNEERQNKFGGPAVYVEGAFMTNADDMKIIGQKDDEGLKAYAKGIVAGILKYYNVENKGYGDFGSSPTTSTGSSTTETSSAENTATGVESKIIDLAFVPEKKFDEMLEEANENQNEQSQQILNYYTLDENWKLITAKWSYSSSGGLKFSKNTPINYLGVLQKYTTPYEYLLNFYIDMKDGEFINDFVDLAMNSQIVIALKDNVTTTESSSTSYTEYDDGEVTEEVTTNEVSESVNTKAELVYADTWFVNVEKPSAPAELRGTTSGSVATILGKTAESSSESTSESEGPIKTVTVTVDSGSGEESGETSGGTSTPSTPSGGITPQPSPVANFSLNNNYVIKPVVNTGEEETVVVDTPEESTEGSSEGGGETTTQEVEIGSTIHTTTTMNRISYTYEDEQEEVNSNEEKFIKLFDPEVNEEAKNALKDEWLIRLMENNDRTAPFVDLTKYLLYRITHNKLYKDITKEQIFSKYQYNEFTTLSTGSGDIPLYTPILSREDFISALQDYYDKTGNLSFKTNFLSRAGEIYDMGIKYGVNPELIITFALKESGFKSSSQNYWGLGTPNGSPLMGIDDFEAGVEMFANFFHQCAEDSTDWRRDKIIEKKEERMAADCNSNGYGDPGTLKGALSLYSDLCGDKNTKHREGDWGDGGNIYLREIYGDEFEAKCGSVHRIGIDDYTIQERADYTAWLFEKQIEYWNDIFGAYGSLGGGATGIRGVCEEITKMYIARNTHYGAETYNNIKQTYESDTNIVCTTYVSVVLYKSGLISEDIINRHNYHYTVTMPDLLRDAGWHEVDKSDLQPGDVLNRPDGAGGIKTGHTVIYVGDGQIYDQTSCTISSGGSAPTGGPKSVGGYIGAGYVAWRKGS